MGVTLPRPDWSICSGTLLFRTGGLRPVTAALFLSAATGRGRADGPKKKVATKFMLFRLTHIRWRHPRRRCGIYLGSDFPQEPDHRQIASIERNQG
jgi:hypothetical protein